MKTKILSILALLLMTVTQGAWAQETLTVYDGTDASPNIHGMTLLPKTVLLLLPTCVILWNSISRGPEHLRLPPGNLPRLK